MRQPGDLSVQPSLPTLPSFSPTAHGTLRQGTGSTSLSKELSTVPTSAVGKEHEGRGPGFLRSPSMFGQKIPAGVARVSPDSRMTMTASRVGQEGDSSEYIPKIWSRGQNPGFKDHAWVQISGLLLGPHSQVPSPICASDEWA